MFIAMCAVCTLITPDVIRTEYAHESHITQHFNSTPFAPEHNYGVNLTGIIAHWNLGGHTYLELGESYRVQGWAPGPRETTTIRVGVQWQLK